MDKDINSSYSTDHSNDHAQKLPWYTPELYVRPVKTAQWLGWNHTASGGEWHHHHWGDNDKDNW